MSTNYIDQITDTAGTTHDISEGDSTRLFRATCSTAASTAAKVATLSTSNRNFSLTAGVRVAVTFTYGNSATTPTLRVDGSTTGTAKTIVVPTAVATLTSGNGTTYNTWGPYETVIFTYNGTDWVNGGSSRSIYNAYNQAASAGSGTVTSVGITNGGGLSISGSPVTTSGSITVGHSNSVTAQTTQAVYPIKIDAQGHISAYGSAVTIPTKTSDLTNDSGFITTDSDEKVKVVAGSSSTSYYPILATGAGTATRQYLNTAYFYDSSDYGTQFILGKNDGTRQGLIQFWSKTSGYYIAISPVNTLTANRGIKLPDKDGTIALTSDIPSQKNLSMSASNGTLTITYS